MRTTAFLRGLTAAATAAAGLAFVTASPAQAATHSVCGSGCDFDSISAAVAAAADGDTITVAAGTYVEPESIVIDKGLTIVGAGSGETIIDGQAASSAATGQIRIRTDAGEDVTIEGLTVENPVVDSGLTVAIVAKSTDLPGPTYHFDDVEIVGNGSGTEYGLWTENSTAALTFQNGAVSNTNFNPVLIEEPRAATTVADSTLAAGVAGGGYFSMKTNPNGTGLDTTGTQAVVGNTFTGSTARPITFHSDFTGNGTGGYTSIVVRDNVIAGATAMGISLLNDGAGDGEHSAISNVVIEDNTIEGNGTAGIRALGLVEDVSIAGNDISGFSSAVHAVPHEANGHVPANITVELNRLADNDIGIRNTTAAPVSAAHNWWGCNAGPGGAGCATTEGDVSVGPWLVVDIAGPTTVAHPSTAEYTVSIDQDSNGAPVDVSAFPGGEVAFGATAGSITSPAVLDPATATATFTPPALNGPVTISGTFDAQTVSLDADVEGVPLAPTRLAADAFVLDTVPTLSLRLGEARATLTEADTGAPLPGREVVFRTVSGELCRATTDAAGVATCSGGVNGLIAGVLNLGYTAHFAGDLNHAASAATGAGQGPLIRIGPLRLF